MQLWQGLTGRQKSDDEQQGQPLQPRGSVISPVEAISAADAEHSR